MTIRKFDIVAERQLYVDNKTYYVAKRCSNMYVEIYGTLYYTYHNTIRAGKCELVARRFTFKWFTYIIKIWINQCTK